MFKLVVAGSRSFADFDRLSADLDYLLSKKSPDEVEIVSGGAAGADALAERYARSRGLAFRAFPADWRRWGKLAGPIRNRQMADYGSAVVVYWDGRSRGSADMISSGFRRRASRRRPPLLTSSFLPSAALCAVRVCRAAAGDMVQIPPPTIRANVIEFALTSHPAEVIAAVRRAFVLQNHQG